MPYEIRWHDEEETIVLIHILPSVTWEMWNQTVDAVEKLIGSKSHRVDVIHVDMHQVGMPSGDPLPHMRRTLEKWHAHPNLGLVISVSDQQHSLLVKMIIDVIKRALNLSDPHNGGFVSRLEDAIKRVKVDRAQIRVGV